MIRTCGTLLVVVLAAVFQVMYFGWAYPFDYSLESDMPRDQERPIMDLVHPYQDRIPSRCWGPPPKINIYQCCPIPLLYPEEMIISCGIKRKPAEESGVFKPRSQRNCNESLCLMTKANLLFENQSVDYEKLKVYIDQWALANPNFTDAIMAAKPICTKPPLRKSFNQCDPDRIFLCLAGNILWNCNLKDYESCQILKNHIDKCKPYYLRPRNPELLNVV